jgi:cytochrome P450/nitrite reductase/ring-hydroxylating ferredoxin subunit
MNDTPSTAVTGSRHVVARSDEVGGPGPYALSARGVDVVLLRTASGLNAFQGRCPHQGALLGEGEIEGGALVCRNHRWRFSTETGRREGGPGCLIRHSVHEHEGQVFVELTGGAPEAAAAVPTRQIEDLPGPKGLPLLGNLLQLDVPRLHEILEGWAREHGPLYRYRMGTRWVVGVAEPALLEQVLRSRPEVFRRLSDIEPVFEEMGVGGVFSAEGAAWRPQRRLAMEALSPRHLRGFYPTLKTVAERLARRWRAAPGAPGVDVVEDLKRFTVDVTTLLAFGHDVNTIEQDDDLIQRRLELIFPAFSRRLFALFPTWRLLRLPQDRRLDRALAEVKHWLRELVSRARDRVAADPSRAERPSNFLEAMLAARDDQGRPFSEDVLFGNLMTMLLAGEDTTAYTLAWAVHHLCDSPSSVVALRQELGARRGAPDDFEAASALAYAGAVANETMRLRPVAPIMFHDANVDTSIGDLHLPAGSRIVLLPRPPTRDARNFERPEEFRPERWLEPPAAHEPSAHLPFGSGPRLCPGRTLALLEMKVVLATLYGAFDVERVGKKEDVRETFAFTMSPVGLRVRLRPRDGTA